MEITVFAKKRTTKEGKTFYGYLTTLRRKDGTEQTVSVRFRESCENPKPENCPMNIIVEKRSANLSKREFIRESTGEVMNSYTLWVSEWKNGSAYVDHSLDDFE